MKTKSNLETFSMHMSILAFQIQNLGKMNLHDISVHAEKVIKILLNMIYDSNFSSTNLNISNYPAIDLIDNDEKKIIQVSSQATPSKIENTLQKDILEEYTGFHLRFVLLVIDHDFRRTKYSNPHNLEFNAPKDILTLNSLTREFEEISIEKQNSILEYLDKEFPMNLSEKEAILTLIAEILKDNYQKWVTLGPESEYAELGSLYDEKYEEWEKNKESLLANDKAILNLYYENPKLFSREERLIFKEFEHHVDSFESNQKSRIDSIEYKRFPESFNKFITGNEGNEHAPLRVRTESIDFFEKRMKGHKKVNDLTKIENTGEYIYYLLNLSNGEEYYVVYCNIYTVGKLNVFEIMSQFAPVNAIVVSSNWNGYTRAAKEFAKESSVGIFKIKELMGGLHLDNPEEYNFGYDDDGREIYAADK